MSSFCLIRWCCNITKRRTEILVWNTFCLIWSCGLFFRPISQLHNISTSILQHRAHASAQSAASQTTCRTILTRFSLQVDLSTEVVNTCGKRGYLNERAYARVCFWQGLDLASANLWRSPDVMEVAAVSIRPLARTARRAASPPPTRAPNISKHAGRPRLSPTASPQQFNEAQIAARSILFTHTLSEVSWCLLSFIV